MGLSDARMGWLLSYGGGALLWAGALTLAALALARLAGRPLGRGTASTLALSLFFLMLTQHPFPDRATLACPVPLTEPILKPFAFASRIAEAWREGGSRALWAVGPLSSLANLLVCMAIGLALSRRGGPLRDAALLGAGLTLGAELSQLTGLWGLYPCAYRQFEVDDLILNLAGVVAGHLLGRAVARPAPLG